MVKKITLRKDIEVNESPIPPIKDKSSSIHKSLTSKKTAITADPAVSCQKVQQKTYAVPVIQS